MRFIELIARRRQRHRWRPPLTLGGSHWRLPERRLVLASRRQLARGLASPQERLALELGSRQPAQELESRLELRPGPQQRARRPLEQQRHSLLKSDNYLQLN